MSARSKKNPNWTRTTRRPWRRWRTFYGWSMAPKMEATGLLDSDGKATHKFVGWQRVWTHKSGALLVGAKRGTDKEPPYYIVLDTRNLRELTKRTFDALAKVPDAIRLAVLKKSLSGVSVSCVDSETGPLPEKSSHGSALAPAQSFPVTKGESSGAIAGVAPNSGVSKPI